MSPTTDAVLDSALKLPREDRARLAAEQDWQLTRQRKPLLPIQPLE